MNEFHVVSLIIDTLSSFCLVCNEHRQRLSLPVEVTSPFCVSSLDLLPGFVDLNVLVAMARDVQDVFQSITDSGGTELMLI